MWLDYDYSRLFISRENRLFQYRLVLQASLSSIKKCMYLSTVSLYFSKSSCSSGTVHEIRRTWNPARSFDDCARKTAAAPFYLYRTLPENRIVRWEPSRSSAWDAVKAGWYLFDILLAIVVARSFLYLVAVKSIRCCSDNGVKRKPIVLERGRSEDTFFLKKKVLARFCILSCYTESRANGYEYSKVTLSLPFFNPSGLLESTTLHKMKTVSETQRAISN